MDFFKTILSPANGSLKEKGSKFYAFLFPVKNTDEIKLHLEGIRKLHFDARHHVFAWRLGADGLLWRANDDGEPTNSSGMPTLGALQKFELTNVLAIVVRYFGGTLLGVRGLMDAYKGATLDAISNAEIIEVPITIPLKLTFEYNLQATVQQLLKHEAVVRITPFYDTQIEMHIDILQSAYPAILGQLSKIFGLKIDALGKDSNLPR